MTEIIIGIIMFLIFGLCVFPVVIVHIVSSLALLRFFSQYPGIALKVYWENHKMVFQAIWTIVPFTLSSVFGYYWYVIFCVDLLLPPVPELRIAALGFMVFMVSVSTYHGRKVRLKRITEEEVGS